MQKMISLTEEQYAAMQSLMAERRIKYLSQFIQYLVLEYEDNKKRPSGRPKGTSRDDDTSDDDIEYIHPDKNVHSPYTYPELEAWAEANRVKLPSRDKLKLYKSN